MDDDGQKVITIAHPKHCSGVLKIIKQRSDLIGECLLIRKSLFTVPWLINGLRSSTSKENKKKKIRKFMRNYTPIQTWIYFFILEYGDFTLL